MRAFLRSTLTWSQAVTSLYGVIGTLVAAVYLPPAGFGEFAILALLQSTLIGLLRAGLLQPALIHQRVNPGFRATAPAVAGFIALASPVYLLAGSLAAPNMTFPEALFLQLATVFSIGHDWLRHRAIADSALTTALSSDVVRLALVPAVAVFAVPGHSGVVGLAAILLCSAPATLVFALRPVRRAAKSPFSEAREVAIWQSAEFGVAQLQTTVPMWIMSVVATSTGLGAFRLAQTWLGPINLFTAALSTNLLADSVHTKQMDVRQRANRMSWMATGVAGSVTLSALVLGMFLAPRMAAVSMLPFAISIVCVGAAAVATGYAGMHMMALRILRQQRLITGVRIKAVCVIWAAYAVGFWFAGAFGALVAGFSATAVVYPALTVLAGRKAAPEEEEEKVAL